MFILCFTSYQPKALKQLYCMQQPNLHMYMLITESNLHLYQGSKPESNLCMYQDSKITMEH